MAVRIKFVRRAKGQGEGYNLIATSKGTSKGRTLEVLGYYNPYGTWGFVKVNLERFTYWVNNGAICSKRVLKVLNI